MYLFTSFQRNYYGFFNDKPPCWARGNKNCSQFGLLAASLWSFTLWRANKVGWCWCYENPNSASKVKQTQPFSRCLSSSQLSLNLTGSFSASARVQLIPERWSRRGSFSLLASRQVTAAVCPLQLCLSCLIRGIKPAECDERQRASPDTFGKVWRWWQAPGSLFIGLPALNVYELLLSQLW